MISKDFDPILTGFWPDFNRILAGFHEIWLRSGEKLLEPLLGRPHLPRCRRMRMEAFKKAGYVVPFWCEDCDLCAKRRLAQSTWQTPRRAKSWHRCCKVMEAPFVATWISRQGLNQGETDTGRFLEWSLFVSYGLSSRKRFLKKEWTVWPLFL